MIILSGQAAMYLEGTGGSVRESDWWPRRERKKQKKEFEGRHADPGRGYLKCRRSADEDAGGGAKDATQTPAVAI